MKEYEAHAWEMLSVKDSDQVCSHAGVTFRDGTYLVPFLGQEITISLSARTFEGSTEDSGRILNNFGYFSKTSLLHYLVHADGTGPSGKWVKPAEITKSNSTYFEGSHVLPLADLAGRFGSDPEGFTAAYKRLGGTEESYGDSGLVLRCLPKLPLLVILWRQDEEFPARADLLFDSATEGKYPADIVWSIAMLTVLLGVTA